jgi:CBS domain-containing protein
MCVCMYQPIPQVKEVATMGANIIVAKKTDSVHDCMKKMLARDIRHLPVLDEKTGKLQLQLELESN